MLSMHFSLKALVNDGIVISGQPGPMLNKKHFLENGLDRSLKLRNAYTRDSTNEKVIWVIYNSNGPKKGGYPDSILHYYKNRAQVEGIEVCIVNSNRELLSIFNSRINLGDSITPFSKFHYYGHATLGKLEIGYINGLIWNKLFSAEFPIKKLPPESFSEDAIIDVVGGCRTALRPKFLNKKSVAEKLQALTNGKIYASDVRVFYPGGPVSDKTLVKKNNGNIIELQGNKKANN